MSEVAVYSHGLVYTSACASVDTSLEEVEVAVNASHPTGLDHGWAVADEPFSTGEANPHPCESDPSRQHWLLVC